MVIPIRDKFLSISAIYTSISNMIHTSNINMTSDIVNNILKSESGYNNYNEMRGHTMISNIHSFGALSMFSSKYDEEYTTRVQHKSNNMVKDDLVVISDNLQLKHKYTTLSSLPHQVSKAPDLPSNTRLQYIENTQLTFNNCGIENRNMFNIQLLYNINQAPDSEFWNSNFRVILLHSSMEYLASNISNIKESLGRIQKYILSKTIESNNTNNIKDFKGISKVA